MDPLTNSIIRYKLYIFLETRRKRRTDWSVCWTVLLISRQKRVEKIYQFMTNWIINQREYFSIFNLIFKSEAIL